MGDPAPLQLLAFWLLAAAGAWTQTLTGFALGLIVMSGATLFHLLPVPVTAAIISVLVLVNGGMVLARDHTHIDRPALIRMVAGTVPTIVAGLILLGWVADSRLNMLRAVLGVFVTLAALQLIRRPQPWPARSPNAAFALAGAAGGLLGGLFATAGPPVIWLLYRQPLPLATVRVTLVAYFALTQALRLVLVTGSGGLTRPMLIGAAGAIPAVMTGTWLARRFPPGLAPVTIRRAALGLLLASGLALIATALATPG